MRKTVINVEKMVIPTYPVMESERMPMFNENRNHQGTKGNPYPVAPVLSVVRDNLQDREYEVVRLENDYIRVILIPELGGRVFEAYDKINHYDFLYRQHVIKPSLIGAYGLWISGGLEFNWPFHHRPSTFMPVNFKVEEQKDGTAICWLGECDPTDRTFSTVGIVVRPDAAWFETRVQVTNRTSLRHSFLMWQNAAVQVNDNYQFVFPPDVNYVNNHHHADRAPLTYPVAQGPYASANYDEATDISWYKNCYDATSHFAAPSKYDFFGGYDHGKKAGVIHIANHHTAPGKKMFTWGCGELAGHWEEALTDKDGRYCELMAGSYSNNQPDFTWLNPYETKCFSDFWYPVGAVGKTSFATLEAAVSVSLETGSLSLQTTKAQKNARVTLSVGGKLLLDKTCDTMPGQPISLTLEKAEGLYQVRVEAEDKTLLLDYTQELPNLANLPEPITQRTQPSKIKTVQELYLHGIHIDQYRDPYVEPSLYWEEALRRDPEHIPSLIALGEYRYRRGYYEQARALLEKAVKLEHTYNLHYQDGESLYLLGLTKDALGETDAAYDTLYQAAWSGLTAGKAMTHIAAIDGRRGDFAAMEDHAAIALEYGSRNPVACAYLAMAQAKQDKKKAAEQTLEKALTYSPLNDLAAYTKVLLDKGRIEDFMKSRRSDLGQMALDIAYDLMDAGLIKEARAILEACKTPRTSMIGYTMAYIDEMLGDDPQKALALAKSTETVGVFPYRLTEMKVLEVFASREDANAKNLLAGLLYDKCHYERAIALWIGACKLQSDNAMYLRNLAVACFSHGQKQAQALTLLARACELAPEKDLLKLEYLYAAHKAGVTPQERLDFIAEHPLVEEACDDYTLEHARAYLLNQQPDEALEVMKAHTFMPAEGGEIAITGLYHEIMRFKGNMLLKEGRAEEALEVFTDALTFPECFHSGMWVEAPLGLLYAGQAKALELLGRKEESLEKYAMVLKRVMPMTNLVTSYAAAMKALGQDISCRSLLSKLWRKAEELIKLPTLGWEETIPAFNSFVVDHNDQRKASGLHLQAEILLAQDKKEEACVLLKESLSMWPENVNAWISLVTC